MRHLRDCVSEAAHCCQRRGTFRTKRNGEPSLAVLVRQLANGPFEPCNRFRWAICDFPRVSVRSEPEKPGPMR